MNRMPFFNFDKQKTFKPLKGHKKGTKQYDLHAFAKSTLGSGDMRAAVALPEGEDENEWLAVHTVDFYNEISLLYGTISEFCTPETCPTMSAGSKYEYLWADGAQVTKPVKVPACEYVDLLLTWIDGQLTNEAIFPTSVDTPFPKNFKSVVKNIMKRTFRVYAHIYFSHFQQVVALSAEPHLNTCFKHFVWFVIHHQLVDAKELAPLEDLINSLTGGLLSGGGAGGGGGSAAPAAGGSGGAAGK
jgi:MOB kinase activator 1